MPAGDEKGMNFIRLATPTTDDARLPKVLTNASGFVYYVSITRHHRHPLGRRTRPSAQAVARIKAHTDLPIAVGFGIKTPERRRDRAWPTPPWSAPPSSTGSATTSDEDGNPKPNWRKPCWTSMAGVGAGRGRRQATENELAHECSFDRRCAALSAVERMSRTTSGRNVRTAAR